MVYKVLIVDDSTFFRKRLSEIIAQDPELELVGQALNGKEAISLATELDPDVVTMDVEMPVMNGIDAVREIMKSHPVPILMFSSLTKDGAQATMDALDAGALDFMPKNFDDIARKKTEAIDAISSKMKELARNKRSVARLGKISIPHRPATTLRGTSSASSTFSRTSSTLGSTRSTLSSSSALNRTSLGTSLSSTRSFGSTTSTTATSSLASRTGLNRVSSVGAGTRTVLRSTSASSSTVTSTGVATSDFSKRSAKYKLVAIGSSTGGPVALQAVLTKIPSNFPLPIIVMQHMPAAFTGPFAQRLNDQCQIPVCEAHDGQIIENGQIYIAPGGKQMVVEKAGVNSVLKIVDGPASLNYKPSVDVAFGSASQIYKDSVLAVVLTGMGADGCKGAGLLKQAGSTVWAQNEDSCVIYGMPKAIVDAGLAQKILDINEIGVQIVKEIAR